MSYILTLDGTNVWVGDQQFVNNNGLRNIVGSQSFVFAPVARVAHVRPRTREPGSPGHVAPHPGSPGQNGPDLIESCRVRDGIVRWPTTQKVTDASVDAGA